jgi:ketosteroid isomerase-like protein
MSQENVEVVRGFIEASNRRDLEASESAMAPDAEIDFSRAIGPYRGVYRRDEFWRLADEFYEAFEVVRTEPGEFIDAGDHVVVPHTHYFRGRDGIEATARDTWLCMVRDGTIVRLCLYPELREALEAVGLSEQDAQSDIDVVRRAYAAIGERDFDALAKVTDAEMVLDFSRSIGPEVGVYRGREGIARFAAANEEVFERFELLPIEFVVGPRGQIVARHRIRAKARRGGLELDRVPDIALVWELRDGKVIKATLYQGRSEALEAAGLSE